LNFDLFKIVSTKILVGRVANQQRCFENLRQLRAR